MQRDIIIADGFYDDPDAIVRAARELEYVSPYQRPESIASGAPVTWLASRFKPARACPFKGSEALLSRLELLVGERIDRGYWSLDYPVDAAGFPLAPPPGNVGSLWNCCFHAKLHTSQQIGEGVHNHVTDRWNHVGEAGWAGILYLNPDAHGQAGLRTWRNRHRAHEYDWMTAKEEWQLVDTFANVYNRLVLHRGRIPHSGAAGWGHRPDDARFFQTFFFRTTAVSHAGGIRIDDLART